MENTLVHYTEALNYKCLEDLQRTSGIGGMNSLNLSYCGKENCAPGWFFGPYIRRNYLIHVVTSGRGNYRVQGKEFEVCGGSAFLIYPGVRTYYRADMKDPWSYMWVGFNGFAAEETVERIGFTRENPVIPMGNEDILSTCMERIFDARRLTYVNELKRTSAFFEFMAVMMEYNQADNAEKKYSDIIYVKMARDLILSMYNTKLKISDIADRIGINRSYLSNIFKREMKMSPQAFLIQVRLERAAQLLRGSDMPVGHIAAAVGYNDALSFSKAFKQKYNISPTEYRAAPLELIEFKTKGMYKNLDL